MKNGNFTILNLRQEWELGSFGLFFMDDTANPRLGIPIPNGEFPIACTFFEFNSNFLLLQFTGNPFGNVKARTSITIN